MHDHRRSQGRNAPAKSTEPAASPFRDRPFAEKNIRVFRPRSPDGPVPRTPPLQVYPDAAPQPPTGPGVHWHVQRSQVAGLQGTGAPSGVVQRLPHDQLKERAYYLVRYQENQLTARLVGMKDGEYRLMVVGTNAIIHLSDPEDIILEVHGKKAEPKGVPMADVNENSNSGGNAIEVEEDKPQRSRQRRPKRKNDGKEIQQPPAEETTCVALINGVPEAIVHDDLVAAYIADLGGDPQHYLQEGEGQAIATHMGVTALVMSQVAGPLIQSNNLMYGNGVAANGVLLHIGGNHYIVIQQADGEENPDFVDDLGHGYVEVEPTVTDGNCLIDGLYLIRDNAHATAEQVAQERQHASGAAVPDDVREVLAAIIIGIVEGQGMGGIGARTQDYIERDPHIDQFRRQLREQREKAVARDEDDEKDEEIDHDESVPSSNMAMEDSRPPVSDPSPSVASSSSGGHELEAAVTRYLQQVNLRGEEVARKLPEHRLVLELWHARYAQPAPSAVSLAAWLESQEMQQGDYFGSDTESEDESSSESEEEDEDNPVWDKENIALLAELNKLIAKAKTHEDIEAILEDERFSIFVVPQYRGIAYMTNRFSKAKRREHRRSSQVGKPVFADAVRPQEMSREDFYTGEHGKDSEVEQRKKEIQKALVEMRKPSQLIDKKRKVAHAKRSGRIFPTKFHVLQSDYSQDYTKSAGKIAEHYGKRQKLSEESSSSSQANPSLDDLEQQVYSNIPFRSHPLVSTADQPGHAVRYALGNKPIAAEKAFRLRPRWRRTGKPQHPYSGKVYTSLHPLRDYLSPTAPSNVWMGRALGTLSIDNDISKEGESSFLAAIKANRVVNEQVIRWPSLHPSKDDSGSHGLSAKERARWREILEKNPPHSAAQRGMKSGGLGDKVEQYYSEKVEAQAERTAASRDQLLVYRNLEGGFSRRQPVYKTPGKSTLSKWELPAKKETLKKRFEDLGAGKMAYGHPTEGFFPDWPSEDFYEGLSDDEEQADIEIEEDGQKQDASLDDAQLARQIAFFLDSSHQTIAETGRALQALVRRRNVHLQLQAALDAATRLVRRAFARIHQAALAGWSQEALAQRPRRAQALALLAGQPVPEMVADEQGASAWLNGLFAQVKDLLGDEVEELSQGPKEPEEEEQALSEDRGLL